MLTRSTLAIANADAGDPGGDQSKLIDHVLNSDVVVLFQSEDVLTRPWCLLELYAAVTAGIPVVSLVCSGKNYARAAAENNLLHLDTSLAVMNPSAVGVLEANNAPLATVAHTLWTCLSKTISVPLNSAGSEHAFRAAVAQLVGVMQRAQPTHVPPDTHAWLEERKLRDGEALVEVIEQGSTNGAQRARMLQKIARTEVMAEELREARAALAAKDAALAVSNAKLNDALEQKDALVERLEGRQNGRHDKQV